MTGPAARSARGVRGVRIAVAVVALAGLGLLAGCGEAEPELVTIPQPLPAQAPFHYPVELWDAGVEGQTTVMVRVTDMGAADSVYVLESSGQAAFDSSAVAGARTLKFAPGRRGDRRIPMWVRLPVRFTRSDSTNSSTNSSTDSGVTP